MSAQFELPQTSELSAGQANPPVSALIEDDATHQEINERRARVENTELLNHLRGL